MARAATSLRQLQRRRRPHAHNSAVGMPSVPRRSTSGPLGILNRSAARDAPGPNAAICGGCEGAPGEVCRARRGAPFPRRRERAGARSGGARAPSSPSSPSPWLAAAGLRRAARGSVLQVITHYVGVWNSVVYTLGAALECGGEQPGANTRIFQGFHVEVMSLQVDCNVMYTRPTTAKPCSF